MVTVSLFSLADLSAKGEDGDFLLGQELDVSFVELKLKVFDWIWNLL